MQLLIILNGAPRLVRLINLARSNLSALISSKAEEKWPLKSLTARWSPAAKNMGKSAEKAGYGGG